MPAYAPAVLSLSMVRDDTQDHDKNHGPLEGARVTNQTEGEAEPLLGRYNPGTTPSCAQDLTAP
jgi:hypothetical protein